MSEGAHTLSRVATLHNLSVDDLKSPSRRKRVVNAKVEAAHRLREMGFSLPEIGVLMACDHTTVMDRLKKPRPPRAGLTLRQSEALDAIRRHMAKHACPPTVQELADELEIQRNGAYEHLIALEKKGAITRYGKQARGIRIVGGCPCCGRELG